MSLVERVGRAAPLLRAGDVPDAVPERGPDVVAEGAGVTRLERRQLLEHLDQRVLDEVLGLEGAAGGRRAAGRGPSGAGGTRSG